MAYREADGDGKRNRQMKKGTSNRIYDRNLRGGVYAGGGVVSLHRGSTCGGRDSDTFRRPGDSADCPGRAGGR